MGRPGQMVVDLLDPLSGRVDSLFERTVKRKVGEGIADHPAGDLAMAVPAHAVGHRP